MTSTGTTARIEQVDPRTAARWLELNVRNRIVRPNRIEALARDMTDGRWQLTGEPIKFDAAGNLLDGQHRLAAIVASGVTLPLLVVRGLDQGAQYVMDTGMKRTFSDALALRGEKDTAMLAATVRLAFLVDRYGYNQLHASTVTHAELSQFLIANPDLRGSSALGSRVSRHLDCPGRVTGYTHWRLQRINQEEARRFFVDAVEKVNLPAGDPVLTISRKFAEARRSRLQIPAASYISLIFRGWNCRRDGRPMMLAKLRSAGGGDIPVPEPH